MIFKNRSEKQTAKNETSIVLHENENALLRMASDIGEIKALSVSNLETAKEVTQNQKDIWTEMKIVRENQVRHDERFKNQEERLNKLEKHMSDILKEIK